LSGLSSYFSEFNTMEPRKKKQDIFKD